MAPASKEWSPDSLISPEPALFIATFYSISELLGRPQGRLIGQILSRGYFF